MQNLKRTPFSTSFWDRFEDLAHQQEASTEGCPDPRPDVVAVAEMFMHFSLALALLAVLRTPQDYSDALRDDDSKRGADQKSDRKD